MQSHRGAASLGSGDTSICSSQRCCIVVAQLSTWEALDLRVSSELNTQALLTLPVPETGAMRLCGAQGHLPLCRQS